MSASVQPFLRGRRRGWASVQSFFPPRSPGFTVLARDGRDTFTREVFAELRKIGVRLVWDGVN
jgi:hypothetical protein